MIREDNLNTSCRINSQEYWNMRFNSDWKDFSGNEQTKYFASILNEMLPVWLINEINENRYAICDLGCAEGDALPVYRQIFLLSELAGEDFSDNAIQNARKKFQEFNFKTSNILEPQREKIYPIVICSNVVEHYNDTYKILGKICERMSKYAIILIPYREEDGKISEHERFFHTKHIPIRVENNHLIYAKSMKCNSNYYPYEQLLLIYAKEKHFSVLSDLTEYISTDREVEQEGLFRQKIAEKEQLLYERAKEFENYQMKASEYQKQLIEQLSSMKQQAKYEKQLKEQLIQENLENEKRLEEKANQEKQRSTEYECTIRKQQDTFGKKIAEYDDLIYTQKCSFEEKMCALEEELTHCKIINRQKDEYILQAQELCNYFATGKLMRLNHFLFRIKGQLLKGTKSDKKEFWSWIRGRIKHTNRSLGAGAIYNPLMVLSGKLQEALSCKYISDSKIKSDIETNLKCMQEVSGENYMHAQISGVLRRELAQDYTRYDVIILSVIDYNFRYQRPQHFAARFAANGHRVFYVNANFVRPDSIVIEQPNIFTVDLNSNKYNAIYAMDGHTTLPWMKEKFDILLFERAIRDAIVIVDYPNWVEGAIYLRDKYGFKIITDYMDDYTGFMNTTEDFLKANSIKLLQCSDMIVTSSQFLFEIASQYTDSEKVEIIRNGTEVEHFYQATKLEPLEKTRKVIGYYGAVAHWFDWEKVCYLAEKFSDCDIVIVGEVTEHGSKLRQYPNIKLLGEKPYNTLPEYLAGFDVCLIPFDTSTDLIKATNPVKFYEYLSAGKKVVTTEIPELMPYKNEYVYMSNENDTFAEYVRLCLEGADCLKNAKECIAFARENDWQKRYEAFEHACIRHIPKISIVVLTYNNLTLNKQCIDSIMHKTAYANYELIIVDNKSTDGTVEYLKLLQAQKIPNVKILLNDENLGFAGGNNIGMAASTGDYTLLLNNDTVVSRGWLTAMVKHLENNPRYGMCNPVTNSIGNESMVKAVYTNLDEFNEYAYSYTAENMNKEYTDADRLPLFATLIRREIIEAVGMLDDTYKVGMFEDDDYTEAVKKHGYDIVIADDAFIHHVNNASFRKMEDQDYKKIFEANKALFEKKWGRKWCMPKYRSGITAVTNANAKI